MSKWWAYAVYKEQLIGLMQATQTPPVMAVFVLPTTEDNPRMPSRSGEASRREVQITRPACATRAQAIDEVIKYLHAERQATEEELLGRLK